MCGYFDDAYWARQMPTPGGSPWGCSQRKKLRRSLSSIFLADQYESPTADDWNSEAVLEITMAGVVNAAQNAQAQLLPLLTDPSEKKALTSRCTGVTRTAHSTRFDWLKYRSCGRFEHRTDRQRLSSEAVRITDPPMSVYPPLADVRRVKAAACLTTSTNVITGQFGAFSKLAPKQSKQS
jgi:hypothetical protein